MEVAAKASPPVCRIVDYGKYCYELSKKQKEAKKHQHSNKTKEVQLRPSIDPHDFGIKVQHSIQFLCEDMKVKISLRYRGRELAHKEIGFETMKKFIAACEPWGTADAPPKFAGRSLGAMISPKPRNLRAENPHAGKDLPPDEAPEKHEEDAEGGSPNGQAEGKEDSAATEAVTEELANTPAAELEQKPAGE